MGLEEGKGLQIDDVKALVNGHVKEGYKASNLIYFTSVKHLR